MSSRLVVIVAVAALFVAFVEGVPMKTRNKYHSTRSQNITEMVAHYGYPVQNYTVKTDDGYILDLVRIPNGIGNGRYQNRPAVVVFHGVLSSADDFVLGGPPQGLAFYLAENGYDVYLANARGSIYGKRHTKLDHNHDSAFWKFTFHQVGVKDLSSIVDKVIEISGQQKVSIIGHNQGATACLVLLSEMPEFNQKLNKIVALGPLSYMQHTTNSILRLISENQHSKAWLIKNLGQNQFNPSNDLISESEYDCLAQNIGENICKNNYFLFNGYGSQNLNTTTVNEAVHHVPAGASSRQILHYAQLVTSGRFERFITSLEDDHADYDLTKITVPVVVFNIPSDPLSNSEDTNTLMQKLPNAEMIKFEQLSNNVDFLWSNDVQNVVYKRIVEALPR